MREKNLANLPPRHNPLEILCKRKKKSLGGDTIEKWERGGEDIKIGRRTYTSACHKAINRFTNY